MTREDAKDLTLSILVIVVALLAADNIWLHVKCSRQADALAATAQRIEEHINPPPGPTLKERTKEAYDKTKDAVKRGYEKVKESFAKKEEPEPVK